MAHCSNCKQSFTGKLCPKCGSPPALTPAQINKALNRHVWLILGGLLGTIFATWRSPLLDQDPVLGLALFLFFAPILIYLVLAVRKRAGTNLKLLRKTFTWPAALWSFWFFFCWSTVHSILTRHQWRTR